MWRQVLHLYEKWLEGCEDLNSIVHTLALDHLTKILPRSRATHIKDRKPETVKEAGEMADKVHRWSYSTTFMKGHYTSCKTITSLDTRTQQFEKISKPAPTATPQPQQSSYSQGQKKTIDAKFFDPDKGAQYFNCHEWGHKAKECNKKCATL